MSAEIEIREVEGVPRLHATMIQEGRIASGLPELFAPNSILWGSEGVAVRVGHGSPVELRALPVRLPDGRVQISAKATEGLLEAVRAGKRGMSVEFYSLKESRNKSGVREIQSAYLEGVALVKSPEYQQGRAEIRSKRRRRYGSSSLAGRSGA